MIMHRNPLIKYRRDRWTVVPQVWVWLIGMVVTVRSVWAGIAYRLIL